jgi:hypothetical protein
MSATAELCRRMREAGIPEGAAAMGMGQSYTVRDGKTGEEFTFWLPFVSTVPRRVWYRMSLEDRQRFQPQQRPRR